MSIAQTIDELGLENRAITAWSEPKIGQRLKPNFGSRHFPKKPLYAILILVGFFSFSAMVNGYKGSYLLPVLFPIVAVAIAWPLIIFLDRLNRRNVWVYPDRILVTHARERIVLPKSELKQIFLYQAKKPIIPAMELLTVNGKSTVVGLPSEVAVSEIFATLSNLGYTVKNDL
jgi:hypothetical protein